MYKCEMLDGLHPSSSSFSTPPAFRLSFFFPLPLLPPSLTHPLCSLPLLPTLSFPSSLFLPSLFSLPFPPYFLPCRFPLLRSFPCPYIIYLSIYHLSLPPPSVSLHLPLFLLITFTPCTSFPPHPHTRSLIPSPQQRCSWETWLGSRHFGVRPQS